MTGDDKKSSVLSQIFVTVAVALLVGGSAPWWWQELFGKKSGSETGADVSGPVTPPPPIVEPRSDPDPMPPPPPAAERTAIHLAYGGDAYGCGLPLVIRIGDREFHPQGSFYQANGVQVGEQPYRISGQILCPGIGTCQAHGEGFVPVYPGATYHLSWRNTTVGQCQVVLQ